MLGQEQDDNENRALAARTATEARDYLTTVTGLARGEGEESAFAVIMLALSQIVATGARLAAVSDVVLGDLHQPDAGPDADVYELHMGLASLLEGLDEYVNVVDPVVSDESSRESLSNDITEVAAALAHGLAHYDRGNPLEALWYWQYSFMASWGERAASGLRTIVSILGHVRLDVEVDLSEREQVDALTR